MVEIAWCKCSPTLRYSSSSLIIPDSDGLILIGRIYLNFVAHPLRNLRAQSIQWADD
jgi:hypothetical protein